MDQGDIEDAYDSGDLNYSGFIRTTQMRQLTDPVTFGELPRFSAREMAAFRRRGEERRNQLKRELHL